MDISDPTVQAALIGVAGVVLLALFTLGGVWIGGRISANAAKEAARIAADATRGAAAVAQQEAQADREEARRALFAGTLRLLAANLLREAQVHRDEIAAQSAWRQGWSPDDPRPGPTVGRTDTLQDLVQELAFTARHAATADRAQDLWKATLALDRFVYVAGRDDVPGGYGEVTQLSDEWANQLSETLAQWPAARRAFVNAVRDELGAEAFPDASHD